MSATNGNGKLDLEGTGAAYIRVSDDEQDTLRQYEALRAFEQRYGVSIAPQFWFKDEGWARDTADRRPDFQRLMKLVESGRVRWIVVDQLDRFGTKNAKQLISYLHRLDEAGCKLYDAAGKEWTGEDIATVITAVVEGEKSKGEQTSKSHRVLGGKIAKARLGEWQGGPVRLGFDVACFSRATGEEGWRVVFEGQHKRLKVYPDGRTERFDGEANFPPWQNKGKPSPEFLRIVPSKEQAKIDAAVSMFKRFASEAISSTALGHYLNTLGFRNCYGGYFQSHHVESMLEDPIYLGYYTYNRRHFGKFHRYKDEQTVLELNYGKKQSKNDKADWVMSHRLFDPLVDQKTWDAVQKKLDRPRRTNSPRSAAQYLAGFVYCGNCGARMVTGSLRKTTKYPRKDGHVGERFEYFCGTYAKCCREKRRSESSCLRNGVFQDTLEKYIARYLEETGKRLELLTAGTDIPNYLLAAVTDRTAGADASHMTSHLTDKLEHDLHTQHETFIDNVTALLDYIRDNDPQGWAEMWAPVPQDHDVPYERAIAFYRRCFSPEGLDAQLAELDAQHTALMHRYADLPTPLAKEKAKKELAALEDRIGELRRQQQDISNIVEQQWREVRDLAKAVKDTQRALTSESGERALRQRAEALQAIIQRIECTFTATGETGGGWGKKNAHLATVTIYPVVGDSVKLSADSKGTLLYSSAHWRMKRTRVGRMR
jgi:DNA invertase Pin-like site-specific DNA recombinase